MWIMQNMLPRISLILSWLLVVTIVKAGASEPEQSVKTEQQETDSTTSWLDSSHSYVHTSTDQLAGWIDQFFGVARADRESAHSSLRLRLESGWLEGEGLDDKVSLRGKVDLPRIDERLSLLFEDEEGGDSQSDNDISAIRNNNQNTDIGLSYKALDHLRSRVDFSVGLRSSGKAKLKARYRFESPWGDNYINRFIETLYFIDGEGFGTRTRYELDHIIGAGELIRWANEAKFAEDIDGVEWSSRLILGKRLDDKSAISYFTWIAGETRPDYLTTSYGLGLRYRKQVIRPWIFYELEPTYSWGREEIENNREGKVGFTVRLEMLFEKKRDKNKR